MWWREEHGTSKLLNAEVAALLPQLLLPSWGALTQPVGGRAQSLEWTTTPDVVVTARMWPWKGWKEQKARETGALAEEEK